MNSVFLLVHFSRFAMSEKKVILKVVAPALVCQHPAFFNRKKCDSEISKILF